VHIEVKRRAGWNSVAVEVRSSDHEGARRIGEAAGACARHRLEDAGVVRRVCGFAEHHAERAA